MLRTASMRIAYLFRLRRALQEAEPVEFTDPAVLTERERLISGQAYRALRKAFGVRLMPFFDFYGLLHFAVEGKGVPPPEGWSEAFRSISRLVYAEIESPNLKTEYAAEVARLRPLLDRLDDMMGNFGAFGPAYARPLPNRGLVQKIVESYTSLIRIAAQDKSIYMAQKPVGVWTFFRLMSDKERKIEKLRREDPELFDMVVKSRETKRVIDDQIQKTIGSAGLVPSRKSLMGKPAHVGTDPITGEEYVYEEDGSVTPVDAFIDRRKSELNAQRESEKVFPSDLDTLRKFPDLDLATGDIEYVSLTDDTVRAGMARIYPTRMIGDTRVVVDGRFKGIALADLINAAGRLIEGTAYDFDPKTGRPISLETKNPDGSVNLRNTREPYVTVERDRLFLRIPSTGAFTELRNKIKKLSALIPSFKYVEKSRNSLFTFEPKDFAAVREALGGMALSTAAMNKVREYFTDLARHEMATAEGNLQDFSAENIGGFRANVNLLTKQKQALAWIESRGRSGVIALDTGVGKTATAIAAIQKMQRDGLADSESGTNGRYLYVCPTALRGNLAKEAHRFLDDPKAFIDRVDVLSYKQFTDARSKDPDFGKDYVAIFFDEAQALKSPGSKQAKAAMSLKHPRKVLLTASPMERSPMEVYALAAISNNIDLNTKEGRADMKAFRARFAEEVGGRIMGIKDDPITARDMRVWVKRNLYFADKRTVDEMNLKDLSQQTDTVTMDPRVEAMYRQAAAGISGILSGLVSKYRDRTIDKTTQNRALETARIKLAGLFKTLTDLANSPGKLVPGARNTKLDRLVQIMDEKAGSQSRVIVFTDSPDLANEAVVELSRRCPWKSHAVALANRIEIVQPNGERMTFGEREYTTADGKRVPKSNWKVHVMQEMVARNPDVGSVVLTSSYAVGQNLQQFDTVVHLDRDTWNSETMKQRTARAWRQGQVNPVTEITIDAVYENPVDSTDATLDQIRRYVQELDSDLFDSIVIESQSEALGAEYFDMKRTSASFYKVNRRMMEMATSPYLAQIKDL
jgi:hypothetical protein